MKKCNLGARLCFSHPAVEGVLLWGFWDQKMFKGKNWSLFDGPAVTVSLTY